MRYGLAVMAILIALAPIGGALTAAYPFGAIAIASSGDIAHDGVAFGISTNHPTQDEANNRALGACIDYVSKHNVKAQCRLVGSFNNQCAADAYDPAAGTPGFGWAIASDESSAKSQALANCKMTAGKTRQQYCQIETSRCDGKKN
jgi:uncharacterized protein DUF4189